MQHFMSIQIIRDKRYMNKQHVLYQSTGEVGGGDVEMRFVALQSV